MEKDVYELTNPQKNIWQLEQVNEKNSSINHILTVMKLKGNLNKELLLRSINKVIEVNDSFQTKFIKNGNSIYQYFGDYHYNPIEVKCISSDDISDIINIYMKLEISLDNLFSFCVVFTPNFTYILYKSHHIIADAWGMTQVAEQIKEIYSKLINHESIDDYKKTSYTSLIKRESMYLNSEKYFSDEQFWDNYVEHLSLSKLFHSSNLFDKKASRYEYVIEPSLYSSITRYCKDNKITEYSFFLGIIALYFNKISNLNSIVIGTPFLNRQKRLKELECTGMFVSTLPLNINVDINDTFISLCQNISKSNLSLYKHSNFPYHKIQELYFSHTKDNSTLYEVGFSYQINKLESKMPNSDFGECYWLFSGEQNNPITLHVSTLNNYKVLYYDYLTSCFSEADIQKMNEIVLHLISEVTSGKNNISDINVLTNYDVVSLSKLNNTGNLFTNNQNVIDILHDVVKKYPDNIAIKCDDSYITYSEFDKKTTQLANHLSNLGVTKNTPVALFFDKSIEMIISMFGVLKAGGCYVPILPDEDSSRIKYILNDCNPKCILTHKNYNEKLPYSTLIINLDNLDLNSFYEIDTSNISDTDVAYIIYTSGSTGNPKGTMVMHKNICSLKNSIEKDSILHASHQDVSISLLKYSFDASGIDIYTSLLFGGKLILVKKEDELNPEKVVRIMEKEHVSRSFLIPKWIEHIAIQDKLLDIDLSHLRILGTGGESLKPYIVENLLSKYPNLRVLNLYGPTETTMFTTCKDISVFEIKNNYTTIGRPIYGSRLCVVNNNLELMPIGIKGELVIYEDDYSIHNIAKGYLNLPEQTDNRFIKIYHPILNKFVKAYRTGDIVKINQHLEIEFFGRNDDIVKVNGGYLVALNEVEVTIQKLLGYNFEVYPIAIPYKNTKAIILFLTKKEKNITLYNIKNYINNHISFYMRPKKIIELENFPRNSSGKIDRKKLKNIAMKYMEENRQLISPKTKIEQEIFNYVKELVGTDDISITDDFIDDLGIDSLSLTAIYSYLEKYDIKIQDIYNNSNIEDLASLIENNSSKELVPNLNNIDNIKILNNVIKFDLSTVLITGVTGFLGIHLLKDLLLSSNVNKIYCIIRNKINLSGTSRLQNMMNYYFNSDKKLLSLINKKVSVLNGDITKNQLGLDKKSYFEIMKNVKTVINCAANVRHFVKPEQIKKDNVQSVQNLINFCGKEKSLAHISTLSIAGFHEDTTKNKIFDENTLYISQSFNNNPYLITKFEAEKFILESTNNDGLNAIIFRLGNIMPRFSDGVFQINSHQNVFLSALKTIIDSKMIAKDFLDLNLEFSPVDECSKIILALLQSGFSNSIYHILNNNKITISELKTLLKFLKYDILDVDLKTFINEINKRADEYTKEYIMDNNLNIYSQEITLARMKYLKLEWSSTDIQYLQKILNIIKQI